MYVAYYGGDGGTERDDGISGGGGGGGGGQVKRTTTARARERAGEGASETMAILILDGWKRHMGPMIAAAAATSFRGACTSVAGITKEKWNSPQAPFHLK